MHTYFHNNWTNPWNTLTFTNDREFNHLDINQPDLEGAYLNFGDGIITDAVEVGYTINPSQLHEKTTPDKPLNPVTIRDYLQDFYNIPQLLENNEDGLKNIDIITPVKNPETTPWLVSTAVPYTTELTVEDVFDTYINPFYNGIRQLLHN